MIDIGKVQNQVKDACRTLAASGVPVREETIHALYLSALDKACAADLERLFARVDSATNALRESVHAALPMGKTLVDTDKMRAALSALRGLV